MSAVFKSPVVRLVGADRPALGLPDDSGELLEFMGKDLSDRFLLTAIRVGDELVLQNAEIRLMDMLTAANHRYGWRLRRPERFWRTSIRFDTDQRTMHMNFWPAVLSAPPVVTVEIGVNGGVLGATATPSTFSEMFCVAPNAIEAIVGLGKMMDLEERYG